MAFFFILFSNCQSSVSQTKNLMGFVNNSNLSQSAGFGEAPQQAFLQPPRDAKIASVATLALLAICALLSK